MDERLGRFVRTQLRRAGRQYEEARKAYREGKLGDGAEEYALPTDEHGRAKIVCRRYAQKRRAKVDREGRPACFDPDHPDCRGCAEDIREGFVETWE
ncbi:DUF7091 family protein [Haloferacaceae archaeon DSL9]